MYFSPSLSNLGVLLGGGCHRVSISELIDEDTGPTFERQVVSSRSVDVHLLKVLYQKHMVHTMQTPSPILQQETSTLTGRENHGVDLYNVRK
jgi:hypothetical protein